MSRSRLVFVVSAMDESSLLPMFASALQSEGYNSLFYQLFDAELYNQTFCD